MIVIITVLILWERWHPAVVTRPKMRKQNSSAKKIDIPLIVRILFSRICLIEALWKAHQNRHEEMRGSNLTKVHCDGSLAKLSTDVWGDPPKWFPLGLTLRPAPKRVHSKSTPRRIPSHWSRGTSFGGKEAPPFEKDHVGARYGTYGPSLI